MKNQLTRDLIVGLDESFNEEFLDNINEYVYTLVSNVIHDISALSPFVRVDKCFLQPANEICTNALTQLSQYDYFLGIDNPQIELNSKTRKNFWKYAWREFRAAWRLGRKKYKKQKQETKTVESIEKYKLSDFKHDFINNLANYLSTTSVIYEHMQHISVIGKEDFGSGVKINIYFTIYDEKNETFKFYNEIKNKYKLYSFGDRFSNMDIKYEECGDMFNSMVRMFNSLFSKSYNRIPNQILIESLIFNCPKVLFIEGDLYQTFLNVANYIILANPKSLASICDISKNIFEEPMIIDAGQQVDFPKLISLLEAFKY